MKNLLKKLVCNIKLGLILWTTFVGIFFTLFLLAIPMCGGTLDECQFLGVVILTIFCEVGLLAWISE